MWESIPRKVDKKSRVPKVEKGIPGSQGDKDKLFFYIAFLFYIAIYIA